MENQETNRKLHTLALGQRHPRLVALASNEHVSNAGSESSVEDVLDVDLRDREKRSISASQVSTTRKSAYDIETSQVTLTVNNNTRATHVASTGSHDKVAGLELDEVNDCESQNQHRAECDFFSLKEDALLFSTRSNLTESLTLIAGSG